MSTHVFSLYVPHFFQNISSSADSVLIDNEQLIHRMVKVLRFGVNDSLIVFDQQQHATIKIVSIAKKNIMVAILFIKKNEKSFKNVTFLLPLLKKEALEQAVYSLCELGVTTIQLVVTEKSRKNLLNDKEYDRLLAIVIAAAEQSKHYRMSELFKPKNLSELLQHDLDGQKIAFDISGASLLDIKNNEQKNISTNVVLIVGPEAGLTDSELQNLKKFKFQFCALTDTVLRAVQAVALSAGVFLIK
ncbi:16S rRNA (uracil(1498)-N(3))-methyltransferase [Candidatus Babeliales bacterium]|nr:16S rRNA (uracil(1498)-N(3))-methyltransferase [Candidatus Babeliales bacterium]